MRIGNYVQYADGEIVFEEGSTGKQVYFIVSGRVEVSHRIDGKKQVMAVLKKGDFFGEMAPLSDDVRSMTITALGELHLYELSVDEMFQYMQRNPEMMRDVYISLAKRLQNTNQKVEELLKINALAKEGDQAEIIEHLKGLIDERDRKIEELQKQIDDLSKSLSSRRPWHRKRS